MCGDGGGGGGDSGGSGGGGGGGGGCRCRGFTIQVLTGTITYNDRESVIWAMKGRRPGGTTNITEMLFILLLNSTSLMEGIFTNLS